MLTDAELQAIADEYVRSILPPRARDALYRNGEEMLRGKTLYKGEAMYRWHDPPGFFFFAI